MSRRKTKVVVFGIDGGTLSLVGPWARRGELPNLSRVMGAGASGVLRSTTHPLTPQAWTTFLTGVNPGKHGVYDFGKRRSGAYATRLTYSTDRRAPALWNHLEAHDLTTGVVNLPLTFPLEPVHGFMVSGMHCPGVPEALGPRSLMDDLKEVAPDYVIDVMSPWYSDTDTFLADVHHMLEARTRLGVHLYDKHRPDLYILVMVAVDRVCHALYKQMSHPLNHNRDGRAAWRYSGEVLRAYQAVDRALGELLAVMDDDTVLVVMSDHGFGTLDRDVSLNQFFLERGLLSFSPKKVRPRLPVVGTLPGEAGRSKSGALWDQVQRAVPPLRWRSDRQIRRGEIPTLLRRWEYVDWDRSVAYAQGLFGNVFINLRGREPEGCVDPAQYHQVREEVAAALGEITDPDDHGPVVDQVYRREELYHGPYLEEAPDLVVVMRDYAYMTRGGDDLTAREVVAPPSVNHSGNHRQNGMLILHGPGIRQGVSLRGAHMMDVMPTILHLMGVPVPPEVDGRVLGEALERPAQLSDLARKVVEVKASTDRRMSRSDEQLIRTRLKNLGYLD